MRVCACARERRAGVVGLLRAPDPEMLVIGLQLAETILRTVPKVRAQLFLCV
jgi:hypothetical protein